MTVSALDALWFAVVHRRRRHPALVARINLYTGR